MKKILFLAALAAGLTLSSCRTQGRYFDNSANIHETQTQVVLSNANFKVVRPVSVDVVFTQTAFKFRPEQLKQSVYAELLRQANLSGAQTLTNVNIESIERTREGLLGVHRTYAVKASALVVEFTK